MEISEEEKKFENRPSQALSCIVWGFIVNTMHMKTLQRVRVLYRRF